MYHYSKKVNLPFETVINNITENLKKQGFGVLTTIDVKETLNKKIDVDFRPYRILGACNPSFAHQALTLEPTIGVMLPCNIAVQDHGNGEVEVSAINPLKTMSAVIQNPALENIASEVSNRLKTAVDELG